MNYKNQNKYHAYLAIQSVCDRNATIWERLPAFVSTYSAFLTRFQTIKNLGQTQTQITTGIAADKKRLRREMCEDALEIAAATRAWAVAAKNHDLAARANYSRTTLLTGRDTASADRCQAIHSLALENVGSLGQHGITAEKLAAFQAGIDAYSFMIQKPRAARAQNKTITAQLKLEFRAADLLLREGLDRLILQFRADAPIFFSDYQNARAVVNDSATRESRKAPAPAAIPSEVAQAELKPLAA